jgi:hypothetical protein
MIEKHSIKGKDVWIKVDAHPAERENPHIIPTEYFTAAYWMEDPLAAAHDGKKMQDEEGATKLFESPVAALTAMRKYLETSLQ